MFSSKLIHNKFFQIALIIFVLAFQAMAKNQASEQNDYQRQTGRLKEFAFKGLNLSVLKEETEKRLVISPRNAGLLENKCLILFAEKNYSELIKILHSHKNLSPVSHKLLALSYYHLKDFKRAEPHFENIPRMTIKKATWLKYCEVLISNDNKVRAAQEYEHLLLTFKSRKALDYLIDYYRESLQKDKLLSKLNYAHAKWPGDPAYLIRLARAYQDDHPQAEKLRIAYLKMKPGDTKVKSRLGIIYTRKKNGKKAIPLLKSAVRANPRDMASLTSLYAAYHQAGNHTKAISTLKQCVSTNAGYGNYQLILADYYLDRGRESDAAFHYEEWVTRNQNDTRAMEKLYGLVSGGRDTARLIKVLELLVKAYPQGSHYAMQLAEINYQKFQDISGLEKLVHKFATYEKGKLYLIEYHSANNNYHKLAPFESTLINKSREDPEFLEPLSEYYIHAQKKKKANKTLLSLLKSKPADRATYDRVYDYAVSTKSPALDEILAQGRIYFPRDILIKTELAGLTRSNTLKVKLYREILEIEGLNLPVMAKGVTLARMMESEKDLEFFLKKWAYAEPGNEAPCRELKALYVSQKNDKALVKSLENLLELTGDAEPLYVELAEANIRLNRRDQALKAYRKILETEPGNKKIQKASVKVLKSMNDKNKLKAGYIDLQDLDPGAHDLQYEIARISLSEKNRLEAFTYLDMALATSPGNYNYKKMLPEVMTSGEQAVKYFKVLKKLAREPYATAETKYFTATAYFLNNEISLAGKFYKAAFMSDKALLKNNFDAILSLYHVKEYRITFELCQEYLDTPRSNQRDVTEIAVKSLYHAKENPGLLRSWLQDFVAMDPVTDNWWYELAKLDLLQDDREAAILHAKKWILLNDNDKSAFKFLLPLVKNKDSEKKTYGRILRRLVELDRENRTDYSYDLGIHLLAEKDYPGALENLKTASKHRPDDADLWYKIGYLEKRSYMDEEAEKHLKRAVELDPGNIKYARTYAHYLNSKEKLKSNLPVLKMLAPHDKNISLQKKLALSLYHNSKFKESSDTWLKIEKERPEVLKENRITARTFFKAGLTEKSIELYEYWHRKDPYSLELLESLLHQSKKIHNREKYFITLENLVHVDPTRNHYQLELADLYAEKKNHPKAREHYLGYIERKPASIKAHVGLFNSAEILKDSLSIMTALEGLTAIAGTAPEYHQKLALMKYTQYGEIEDLENLHASGTDFDRGNYILTLEYYQRKEFQRLIPFGSYLKKNYLKKPELSAPLAEWHVLRQNKEPAGKAFVAAVQNDSGNRELFERALAYIKDTRGKRLKEILAHGNRAFPQDLNLSLEYASLVKKPVKALAAYEVALKIYPENPVALKGAARASFTLKKYDQAEKYLRNWAAIEPSIEAWSMLSNVYGYQDNKKNQAEALGRVAKLSPESHVNSFRAGKTHAEIADYGKSLDFLRNASSLNPENYETNRLLGLVLEKLNRYSEAAKYLQPIESKNGYDETLSAALMRCYKNTGNIKRAYALLKILHKKSGGKKEYALPLARIYQEENHPEQVASVLEKSKKNYKPDDEMSFLLLNAYVNLEKKGKAREVARGIESRFSKESQSTMVMAEYFIYNKEYSKAKVILARIQKTNPTPETHFYLGKIAFLKNRWGSCIKHLKNYSGFNTSGSYYLGKCYEGLGKNKKAIENLEVYYTAKKKTSTLESLYGLYLNTNNLKGAVKTLKRILAADPDNDAYRIKLANHYQELKENEKTLAQFSIILKRNPDHPRANLVMGKSFADQGQYQKAGKMLKIALKKYPKDWEAQLNLGLFYYEHKKDYSTALRHFRKSYKLNSHNPRAAMGKLQAVQKLGLEGSLAKALEDVLKNNPHNTVAAEKLAGIRYSEKNYREASILYKSVVKNNKNHPLVWSNYAYSLNYIGEKEKAMAAFSQALENGADSRDIRMILSGLYIESGNLNEAEKILKKIIKSEPTYSPALYNMALIAKKSDQLPMAESYINSALRQNPGLSKYNEELGRLHYLQKNYLQTTVILSRVTFTRLSHEGKMMLADSYILTGRNSNALEIYLELYKESPSAELLNKTASIYIETRSNNKAVKLISESEFNREPEVRHNLARAYNSAGKFVRARSVILKLLKNYKSNPEYLFTLGNIYFQESSYKKAIREFNKALAGNPEFYKAMFHTGLAWTKLGKWKKADLVFNHLVSTGIPLWSARGYYGLAQVKEKQKNYPSMVELLERSLAEQFEWEPMYLLMQGLVAIRDIPAAEELIRRAHKMNKEHPLTISAKSELLLAKNRKADAYRLLKRGLEKNPRSCDIVLQIAKVNWRMGNMQHVTSNSKFAMSVCPEKPEPYLLLGYVANQAYDRKEARKQFKTYVKRGGNTSLLPEGY